MSECVKKAFDDESQRPCSRCVDREHPVPSLFPKKHGCIYHVVAS